MRLNGPKYGGANKPPPLHPLSDGSDHYLLKRGATVSKDLGLVPNWGYAPLVAPPPRVSPIVKYGFFVSTIAAL